MFAAFAASEFSGVLLGVYRTSTQVAKSGQRMRLPVVLTAPTKDLDIFADDRLFVLLGAHTLARAASKIQTAYLRRKEARGQPAAPTKTGTANASGLPPKRPPLAKRQWSAGSASSISSNGRAHGAYHYSRYTSTDLDTFHL